MNQLPGLAEYGSQIADQNLSIFTELDRCQRELMGRKKVDVYLYHQSPGYVDAGSVMRLQKSDVYGYRWSDGRANHGRMFNNLADAREHFNEIKNLK